LNSCFCAGAKRLARLARFRPPGVFLDEFATRLPEFAPPLRENVIDVIGFVDLYLEQDTRRPVERRFPDFVRVDFDQAIAVDICDVDGMTMQLADRPWKAVNL